MLLPEVLAGLAAGTLTVPVVKWILELELFDNAGNGQKRMIAVALCFILGAVGFFALVFTGTAPMPVDIQEWINSLWPVGSGAFLASQVLLSWLRSRNPDYGK